MGNTLPGKQLYLTSAGLEDIADLMPAYNGDEQFNLWSGGTPTISEDGARADMIEALAMPGGAVWKITRATGEIIGVAQTAFVPPPHTAWIALFIIRKAYQRQGCGSEAAALLEEYLFTPPAITSIGLAVLLQNTPALAFWEQRGYERGMQRRDQNRNEVISLRLVRARRQIE